MADSAREAAVKALFAALGEIDGPVVLRDEALPSEIPSGGLVILREGDPGEPEEIVSPPRDAWIHANQVEVYVRNSDANARAAARDAIGQAIAAALGADRTLGGAVTHVDWGPPVPNTDAVEGASAIGAWVLTVNLHYETDAGGLAS